MPSDTSSPRLFVAPMQGYTDEVYRRHHADIYGAADAYFSPFLRMEGDGVRARDLRDITSSYGANYHLIPQIIFRDVDEFRALVQVVQSTGYNEIDINAGCPFPPQVKRGRGAGLLSNARVFADVAEAIRPMHNITFSMKMRLGVNNVDDWCNLLPIINDMPLHHVTIHPRIAVQQYRGTLHIDQFWELLSRLHHPVVFNGDVASTDDIRRVVSTYPMLYGIMVGRGLLARPSLFAEYRSKTLWSAPQRLTMMLRLHDAIFNEYRLRLCGDTQILSKIRTFWDYAEPEIGHRAFKLIRKATTMVTYRAAVDNIVVE